MKKLILFIALLIPIGLMAQTIKIPSVKSTELVSTVTYSDGIVITVKGANNTTTRKPLYLAAYALAHPPIVIPPTGTKPVFTPPTGDYIEVTLTSGKTLDLTPYSGKKIRFKSGNYSGVYITGNKLVNIIIDATPANFDNSTVELGSGDLVEIYGLKMSNTAYRVLRFDFALNNFHLYNSTFVNCGDWALYCNNARNVSYNGTDATMNKGLKIINNTFDNFGNIQLDGELNKDNGSDYGLFKDVEIAYNTFKNSSPGNAVSIGNACNYDIHHNIVDNFNALSNIHNGVFFMQGNGKFHDNKLTNYQGNSIRMWLFSRGKTPITNEIYNNICFNTRKYGAFELQQFARNIWGDKTTFANAKVYNNTVGQMNTNKDWEGQVLDLYDLSGTVDYYNNLGFNLNTVKYQSSVTNMINNMGNTKLTESNNKYFPNKSDAVNDNLTSKHNGIGAVQ